MANMKNRRENGTRALFLGSKPHSNGDVFSRSVLERMLSIFAIENTNIEITVAIVIATMGIYITQKYIIFSFD